MEAVTQTAMYVLRSVVPFLPRPLENVPQPKGSGLLLGSLPGVISNIDRIHDYFLEQTLELQKDPQYRGCWQQAPPFAEPTLMLTDPELLQYVLDKSESHPGIGHTSDAVMSVLLESFGASSIFVVEGKDWRLRRKYYSYLFSTTSLRDVMFPQFVKCGEKLARLIERNVEAQADFDVQDLFLRASLDATSLVAFDQDPGCLDATEVSVMKEFDIVQETTIARVFDPFWKIKRFLRFHREMVFADALKGINNHLYGVLAKRRDDAKNGENRRQTILDIIEARMAKDGQEMSDKMMRDVVWDFLLAGRDTTAAAATWVMYYLAQHPKVCDTIREEMEGKDLSSCNVLVNEMPYLTAVCLEAQRLNPSTPTDSKGAKCDMKLPNGVKVRKGTTFMYNAYTNGRNPQIWGEDVLAFKPERWFNARCELRSPTEGEYPAFNGGPRRCLGKNMALLELKCFFATLLQRFNFSLATKQRHTADDGSVPYSTSLVLLAKGGMWLRASRRT